ncbi:MAG: NADP-dependent phosphogluconate dehydrogenase [Planctomycetota bacterium]
MMAASGAEKSADIGLIGFGVMGRNLALNMEEHGYAVAVWDQEAGKVDSFLREHPGCKLQSARTTQDLVERLRPPRRVLIMVPAGPAVDAILRDLALLLERGDIVIDGGNSWWEDTERRVAALAERELQFLGVGISGGEKGARHGPSLMPGGARSGYESLRELFEAIAAKTDSGPCVTYVGPGGAGHFVKTVHNGIEYADMQLIAEAYDLVRRGCGLAAGEIASLFETWNCGALESFLIELTAKLLRVQDRQTGRPLVESVLDKAGQKGTGRWTVKAALDLEVPVPTIAAAVDARVLSALKEERERASRRIAGPEGASPAGEWRGGGAVQDGGAMSRMSAVHDALLASKICSYAQGLNLIRAASEVREWGVDLKEAARIWKGGCIIRARLLDVIMRAYEREPQLPNLLLDESLGMVVHQAQQGWRHAVRIAHERGIPVPAMSASLSYFDAYRTARLPQNLTQAQRDAFGAHTYQRVDDPSGKFVHTDWLGPAGPP